MDREYDSSFISPKLAGTAYAVLAVAPVAGLASLQAMGVHYGMPWWFGLDDPHFLAAIALGLLLSVVSYQSARSLFRHGEYAPSIRFFPWIQGGVFLLALVTALIA